MKTCEELALFAEKVLNEGWLYRFGCYGNVINGIRRSDCYGIRKACSWDTGKGYSIYNKSDDRNADTAYKVALIKGKASVIPEIRGLLVGKMNSMGRVYHAGIYVGNGMVIDIYETNKPARKGSINGWNVFWYDTSINYDNVVSNISPSEPCLFAVTTIGALNLRKSPNGAKCGSTKNNERLGISEVSGAWGRIQNSPLWICITDKYCRKEG